MLQSVSAHISYTLHTIQAHLTSTTVSLHAESSSNAGSPYDAAYSGLTGEDSTNQRRTMGGCTMARRSFSEKVFPWIGCCTI